MIGHDNSDEIERALAELTEEQEDELDEALNDGDKAYYWSSRRRMRWRYQESIRRGWLMGPA